MALLMASFQVQLFEKARDTVRRTEQESRTEFLKGNARWG